MTQRDNLIAARELAKLSRPDLGKLIGISRVHIFRVETGLLNPSPSLMGRWARALAANPTDIWPERDLDRVRRHVREGRSLLDKARRAAA